MEPNWAANMKLSTIHRLILSEAKGDKAPFTYRDISETLWRNKFGEEEERSGISFDLENNDAVSHRRITIPQDHWDYTNCTFICESYAACGDWEDSSYYFRCQLVDGYAYLDGEDMSLTGKDDSKYFCYIPGKDEGNHHLVKNDNGSWGSVQQDDDAEAQEEKSERNCWASLKKRLEEMVKEAIKGHKTGKEL